MSTSSGPLFKSIGLGGSVLALLFPFIGEPVGLTKLTVNHIEIIIIFLSFLCGGIGIIVSGKLTLYGRFGGSMAFGRRHSRMIGIAFLLIALAIVAHNSGTRLALPGTLVLGGAGGTLGSLALCLAYGEQAGQSGYLAFAFFVLAGVGVTLLGFVMLLS